MKHQYWPILWIFSAHLYLFVNVCVMLSIWLIIDNFFVELTCTHKHTQRLPERIVCSPDKTAIFNATKHWKICLKFLCSECSFVFENCIVCIHTMCALCGMNVVVINHRRPPGLSIFKVCSDSIKNIQIINFAFPSSIIWCFECFWGVLGVYLASSLNSILQWWHKILTRATSIKILTNCPKIRSNLFQNDISNWYWDTFEMAHLSIWNAFHIFH